MPMNVENACWDKTGTVEDMRHAQQMVGHCHRMSVRMAASQGYPSDKALQRAVWRRIARLWCPRTPADEKTSESIREIAGQIVPVVKRVMANPHGVLPELILSIPVSQPISNLIYMDVVYNSRSKDDS